MKNKWETRHLWLISDFTGNLLSCSPFRIILTIGWHIKSLIRSDVFLSFSSGLYNHEMKLEYAKNFSFIKMIICYLSLSALMGSIAICWSMSVKLPLNFWGEANLTMLNDGCWYVLKSCFQLFYRDFQPMFII